MMIDHISLHFYSHLCIFCCIISTDDGYPKNRLNIRTAELMKYWHKKSTIAHTFLFERALLLQQFYNLLQNLFLKSVLAKFYLLTWSADNFSSHNAKC